MAFFAVVMLMGAVASIGLLIYGRVVAPLRSREA
jgi:hypothetical protein